MGFERRITLLALFAGLPGVLLCMLLLWLGDCAGSSSVDCRPHFGGCLAKHCLESEATRDSVHCKLFRTFSPHCMKATTQYARGERSWAMRSARCCWKQMNLAKLSASDVGALEATALLRTVMSKIEVAVFAFDGAQRLRLVNRAGENYWLSRRRVCWANCGELGLSPVPRSCGRGRSPYDADGFSRWSWTLGR